MDNETIPGSVLALLKESWKPYEGVYDRTLKVRPHVTYGPSYYCYYKCESEDSHETGIFKRSEIDELTKDGVLVAKSAADDCVTVHEQQIHALSDFCGEVWDAWRKLRSRLKEVQT